MSKRILEAQAVISTAYKGGGVKRAVNDITSAQARLGRVGKSMMVGGGLLTAAVTAPILAFGKASIAAAEDFDHAMRGVKTLLDSTSFESVDLGLEAGFKKMKADALDVLADIPIDVQELPKALFDTVSAGIEAGRSVEFVGNAGKLAVAGLTDLGVAVDGGTSALNAWQMSADRSNVVMAQFFTAQKYGKTTVAELATGLGEVAGIAASVGVSFEEVEAAVAAATTAGLQTNKAYTGVRALLSNIIKPGADATKMAKRYGIEFGEAALRTKGLTGWLADFVEVAKTDRGAAIKMIGSVEGLNLAMSLASEGGFKKYTEILRALNDEQQVLGTFGAAYDEQAESAKNLKVQLEGIKSSLKIKIGEQLLPYEVEVLKQLSGALKTLDENLSPETTGLLISLGGGLAAIGPVLFTLGLGVSGLLKFGKALGVIGGVLVRYPFLGRVLGIAGVGVGAAALGYKWSKDYKATQAAADRSRRESLGEPGFWMPFQDKGAMPGHGVHRFQTLPDTEALVDMYTPKDLAGNPLPGAQSRSKYKAYGASRNAYSRRLAEITRSEIWLDSLPGSTPLGGGGSLFDPGRTADTLHPFIPVPPARPGRQVPFPRSKPGRDVPLPVPLPVEVISGGLSPINLGSRDARRFGSVPLPPSIDGGMSVARRQPTLEDLIRGGTIEAEVTAPVSAELKGRADVDVRIRVDGPGRVIGMSARDEGDIQVDVGVGMTDSIPGDGQL